jgi:hypothetical protein
MFCAAHADRAATATCARCGSFSCAECIEHGDSASGVCRTCIIALEARMQPAVLADVAVLVTFLGLFFIMSSLFILSPFPFAVATTLGVVCRRRIKAGTMRPSGKTRATVSMVIGGTGLIGWFLLLAGIVIVEFFGDSLHHRLGLGP